MTLAEVVDRVRMALGIGELTQAENLVRQAQQWLPESPEHRTDPCRRRPVNRPQ